MTVQNQFTKYAKDYDEFNIIQRIVSKALVREIQNNPKTILELGCGSGQIFREIDLDFLHYKAIDFSHTMCEIHPKAENLTVKCLDFDSEAFFDEIKNETYDLILSSSALQWSKKLPKILQHILPKTKQFRGVLFTSNTFKEIYEITKKPKTILSLEEIEEAFSPYGACFELFEYKLYFENKKELFDYIKNSGVGGDNTLTFSEAKELYKKYHLDYLSFEVVFVTLSR